MSAIGQLLCRIGIHRYRDLRRGHWNGVTQEVLMRCTRCDDQKNVLLISPLSGPRRGPMHPAAEVKTNP